jgi:hypothetical protein
MVKRAKQGGDGWSMKTDRELIVLSKTKTIETLADHFRRPPKSILEGEEVGLVDQAPREVKMKHGPRPKRSKGIWYVSFEPKERRRGKRTHTRVAETFQTEQDAKAFARAKLADGLGVSAGTLNPHLPKRIIASVDLLDWLNEPDD